MKNTTQQPKKRKWTGPIKMVGKSIRLKWVDLKYSLVALMHGLHVDILRIISKYNGL